jgi:hypothetical protein
MLQNKGVLRASLAHSNDGDMSKHEVERPRHSVEIQGVDEQRG